MAAVASTTLRKRKNSINAALGRNDVEINVAQRSGTSMISRKRIAHMNVTIQWLYASSFTA